MIGGFLFPLTDSIESITASSFQDTNPVENVIDGVPGKKYISDGSTCDIIIKFYEATLVSGISIHNHNIPATGTVVARWGNDGISWPESDNFTLAPDDFFALLEREFQYLKLTITVPSGNIEVGQVVPATWWELPRSFKYPYRKFFRVKRKVDDINGQFYQRILSKQTGYELPFDNITASERAEFDQLLFASYLVFVPDQAKPECFHGVFRGEIIDSTIKNGKERFKVEFWENAILC